jgi:DNA-binding SARP family transcriptional activator
MAKLKVRLLGPVGLWSDLREIPLGTPKQRCLLAALALAPGRPVSIGALIERLWGQSPPNKTNNSLYTYVARLRGLLKNESAGTVELTRNATSYLLKIDPECVHLHQSRTLLCQAASAVADGRDDAAVSLYLRALRLWRDEPLAGLRGAWADRARAGLMQERLAALSEYFAAELRLGRHVQVIRELSTATSEHPLDETLAGQLMVSLYRSQRRIDALTVFHWVKDELAEQLGLNPGPDLRRLYEELLRNDPALDLRARR